ncbi:hypothetical protein [Actinopolymorpha alba]|uniref:hypothetical protein n=1 Tax=Actinopolymorpha alba TaxID=533267 RepID=UPI0003801143|nr:hypothetical protein [Actinopolymorpha alba]
MTVGGPDNDPRTGPVDPCPYAVRLGVIALGVRDEQDPDVERHLRDCPVCQRELARVTAMPTLLAAARAVGTDPDQPASDPAPLLLARVFEAIATERQTRSRRRLSLMVAATVLAAAASVGVAVTIRPPARQSPPPLAATSRSGVSAQMTVTAQPWGSRVAMTLTGLRPGTTCRLVVRAQDGRVETIGSWRVTYANTIPVEGMTSVPSDELVGFEVVDDKGRRLVTIAVPPAEGKDR